MYEIKKVLGKGTYGIVYLAVKDDTEVVAIKRNFIDKYTHGISILRELSILNYLKNVPYITHIKDVVNISNQIFPKLTKTDKDNYEKEDNIHFVLELEKTTAKSIVKNIENPYKGLKIIFFQLLNALYNLHTRGITHLDLKPGNILFNDDYENPIIKLCDFGLSTYNLTNKIQPIKVRGNTTLGYRAPEICINVDYNEKADIWSAVINMIEMISKKTFTDIVLDESSSNEYSSNNKDEGMNLVCGILNTIPFVSLKQLKDTDIMKNIHLLTKEAYVYLQQENLDRKQLVKNKLIKYLVPEKNKKMQSLFNTEFGDVSLLADLMSNMFVFDYNERYSALDCLRHSLFNEKNNFTSFKINNPAIIKQVRKKYNINKEDLLQDRKTVFDVLINIYNNRNIIEWYSHDILFHAEDVFELYLERCNEDIKMYNWHKKMTQNNEILSIMIYTCLYIYHKFNSILDVFDTWSDFSPTFYNKSVIKRFSNEFENVIVNKVCNYNIYRKTCYEEIIDEYSYAKKSAIHQQVLKWSS